MLMKLECNFFNDKMLLSTKQPIGDRVDGSSATKTADSGSIPDWVKPKAIKIGIHNFPAWRSALKGTV